MSHPSDVSFLKPCDSIKEGLTGVGATDRFKRARGVGGLRESHFSAFPN